MPILKRRSPLYWTHGLAAAIVFSITPLESASYDTAGLSVYVALAALVLTLAACAIAWIGFRSVYQSSNRANAALFALTPFLIDLLLYMFRLEPNVHGMSFISLFLFTAISEICALSLVIGTSLRQR